MSRGHVFRGEKYRSVCGEDDGDWVEFKKTLSRLGEEEKEYIMAVNAIADRKDPNRVNVEPRRKQIDCTRVMSKTIARQVAFTSCCDFRSHVR